jgi:hypothetical protein
MNFFIRKYCSESADFSRAIAAAAQILHGGSKSGGIRRTQRHQPSQPFCNCVNSAVSRLFLACHFGG